MDLTVFPTIFIDNVRVHAEAELINYSVFNTTGILVRTGELAGNAALLDLQGLASGTYVLEVSTGNGSATQRIIKQ